MTTHLPGILLTFTQPQTSQSLPSRDVAQKTGVSPRHIAAILPSQDDTQPLACVIAARETSVREMDPNDPETPSPGPSRRSQTHKS